MWHYIFPDTNPKPNVEKNEKALEGGCIGKVVESKNSQFAVGDYVLGMKGWRFSK